MAYSRRGVGARAMELASNRRSADGSCDGKELAALRTLVGIGVGGALGALARYGLDGLVSRRASSFPWGTFVINVSGSFLLGVVFTVMTERFTTSPWIRSSVMIGVLGAYTTFSTLSLESFRLLEDGAPLSAAANLLLSLGAGLLAVYAGIVLGRAV